MFGKPQWFRTGTRGGIRPRTFLGWMHTFAWLSGYRSAGAFFGKNLPSSRGGHLDRGHGFSVALGHATCSTRASVSS